MQPVAGGHAAPRTRTAVLLHATHTPDAATRSWQFSFRNTMWRTSGCSASQSPCGGAPAVAPPRGAAGSHGASTGAASPSNISAAPAVSGGGITGAAAALAPGPAGARDASAAEDVRRPSGSSGKGAGGERAGGGLAAAAWASRGAVRLSAAAGRGCAMAPAHARQLDDRLLWRLACCACDEDPWTVLLTMKKRPS